MKGGARDVTYIHSISWESRLSHLPGLSHINSRNSVLHPRRTPGSRISRKRRHARAGVTCVGHTKHQDRVKRDSRLPCCEAERCFGLDCESMLSLGPLYEILCL